MLPMDVYKQIVAKNGPTTLACTGISYTDTHTYGAYCTALNNCQRYPKVCERNWRKRNAVNSAVCCLLLLLLFSFVGVVVTVTYTHTHIHTRTRSRHSSSYSSIPSTFVKLKPARENKTKQTRNTTRKTRGNYWLLCNVPGAKLFGVFSPSASVPSVCCDSLVGLNCWQSN